MTDQQAQGATDPSTRSTSASSETSPEQTKPENEASLRRDAVREINNCLYRNKPDDADLQDVIQLWLSHVLKRHEIVEEYNLLGFFDDQQGMNRYDTMEIYWSLTSFEAEDREKKPTLLVLHSLGGQIEAAYLIGKVCRNHLPGRFAISVPRQAKSAATLLCCAADEIHMGGVSELGPIDPQIGGLPALGLKNSIEHIAQLCEKHPKSADMFSKYLHLSMKPQSLGYSQRIAKSAEQYATRLLDIHAHFKDQKGNQQPVFYYDTKYIAKRLVHDYHDHGFVIDSDEAMELFCYHDVFLGNLPPKPPLGNLSPKPPWSVVRVYTPEYFLGNDIHRVMDEVRRHASYQGYDFWFTGSISRHAEPGSSRFNFRKRR